MEKERETDLAFDRTYRDLRNQFADKYFGGGKREACIFALSLGIRFNRRAPRKSWKAKSLSWDDLNRLETRVADFGVLFDYMDLDDGDMSTKKRIDEFVTGGLRYIEENDLIEDGSLVEIELD